MEEYGLLSQNFNCFAWALMNRGEGEGRDNYLSEDFARSWKIISTTCLVWKFGRTVALTGLKLWPSFTDMMSSNSYSPHQPKKIKGTRKGTLYLLF